jgi:hypothetical protein
VLLLPFQVSVLGTPSPAVTPTNLLYNVVATPLLIALVIKMNDEFWLRDEEGKRTASSAEGSA